MIDPAFFDNYGPFSLAEIAKISNSRIVASKQQNQNNSGSLLIDAVAPLQIANHNHIAVLNNRQYLEEFKTSKAGACFVEEKYVELAPPHMILLVSDNPYKAYALTATAFYPPEEVTEYRSEAAHIHDTAVIGDSCYIDANVVIGPNVVIGNNCRLGPGTSIGKGVKIGDGCLIAAGVTISHSIIGRQVIIHPGARIGQDGFGFASDRAGHYKVPQLGRVLIDDYSEIGANTCIDRGSGHDTRIGKYCMIDNLSQIGHNVEIGDGSVIVSQVGISGSTIIGKFVQLGGQVGISGHLSIGDGAKVAAKSGVMRNIQAGEVVGGFPALPVRQWHRQTATLNKLTNTKKENNE